MTEKDGDRIKALMKYHGLSQRKLAKEFGVSHSSINLFLDGRFVSANLEAKFAELVKRLSGGETCQSQQETKQEKVSK